MYQRGFWRKLLGFLVCLAGCCWWPWPFFPCHDTFFFSRYFLLCLLRKYVVGTFSNGRVANLRGVRMNLTQEFKPSLRWHPSKGLQVANQKANKKGSAFHRSEMVFRFTLLISKIRLFGAKEKMESLELRPLYLRVSVFSALRGACFWWVRLRGLKFQTPWRIQVRRDDNINS